METLDITLEREGRGQVEPRTDHVTKHVLSLRYV